jgi:hypothetical protein
MRNTANVTGGNPIAVLLQSILGVSAINPLVAFYDIHGGEREVLFFLLKLMLEYLIHAIVLEFMSRLDLELLLESLCMVVALIAVCIRKDNTMTGLTVK